MSRVVSEEYPSLVTHWMPDDRPHRRGLDCWCNPSVKNDGLVAKGTTVQHHMMSVAPYVADINS